MLNQRHVRERFRQIRTLTSPRYESLYVEKPYSQKLPHNQQSVQLSQIALEWMLCEAELGGLLVDPQRKADILGSKPPCVAPDPTTKNQHQSLHGAWWVAELWPKIAHVQTAPGAWHNRIRLNLGRRRSISPDSLVHESVQQRRADPDLHYNPANLPQQPSIVRDRPTRDQKGRAATM